MPITCALHQRVDHWMFSVLSRTFWIWTALLVGIPNWTRISCWEANKGLIVDTRYRLWILAEPCMLSSNSWFSTHGTDFEFQQNHVIALGSTSRQKKFSDGSHPYPCPPELGPLIIRLEARSRQGHTCPDTVLQILSGLSPSRAKILQICPDNRSSPIFG